mgnify:CR=1 FL=1
MSFFFQAEDGIRDLVRSRGLGDVYKRQEQFRDEEVHRLVVFEGLVQPPPEGAGIVEGGIQNCLLYTSEAADGRSSVDSGGRRIIKKKMNESPRWGGMDPIEESTRIKYAIDEQERRQESVDSGAL